MSDKKIIHVEAIRAAHEILVALDRLDLADITFYEDGKPMDIPEAIIEDLKFFSLSNRVLILSEHYWVSECNEGELNEDGEPTATGATDEGFSIDSD